MGGAKKPAYVPPPEPAPIIQAAQPTMKMPKPGDMAVMGGQMLSQQNERKKRQTLLGGGGAPDATYQSSKLGT